MNAKTEKDCAGKALYLEFRKDNYTYQVIITPPAIDIEGNYVPASAMERRISSWHPRRNWNFSSVPTNADFALQRDADGSFSQMLDTAQAQFVASVHIKRLIARTLDSLFHKGWALLKQPVAVEATYKDLALIKSGKTSNDLVRRIERSRKAFGFPEALFDEPVTTPVA
jgi:hypothetical protein